MHFPHIPDPILPISHQMHFPQVGVDEALIAEGSDKLEREVAPTLTRTTCLFSHSTHLPHMSHTHVFHISPAFFVCVFLALTRLILPISHTPILPIYIAATFEGSGSGREEAERDRG